jgi:chromosome segregation ATPase
MGGGGPRDHQARLELAKQRELLNIAPSVQAVEINKEAPPTSVDMSQFLSLDVVRQKIEEAVEFTRKTEADRYESGLKSLNDQLNAAKKKSALATEQLLNANVEIVRLKEQLLRVPTSSSTDLETIQKKESELQNLKIKLENRVRNTVELTAKVDDLTGQVKSKDEEIAVLKFRMSESEKTIQLTEESGGKIKALEEKLDKLFDKIADGSISPFVGSKMDKPSLEDRIFIDPIEKGYEPKLESHIEVKDDPVVEIDRDVSSDLAKLRNLLKL